MYLSDAIKIYLHPANMAMDIIAASKSRLFPGSEPFRRFNYKAKRRDGIVEFEFNGKTMKLMDADHDVMFMDSLIDEVFIKQAYGQLEVKDKAVLDIGGTIGDTAIYFKEKGAFAVNSYEPMKKLVDLAVINFGLNHLTNMKMHNECATSKTVDEFCDEFKGRSKAMKLDCEGGEYEILLNSKRLAEFDGLILEYHYGYLNLVKKLESDGFEVRYSKPQLAGSGWKMQAGFIYARR